MVTPIGFHINENEKNKISKSDNGNFRNPKPNFVRTATRRL